MKQISTNNAPAAIGPYSQALRTGNMMFVSGQIPVDPATGLMAEDIKASLPYADGIVIGALDAEKDIDIEATRRLVEASEDKPVTFHRAFDVCRDPLTALEQIINSGCRRILTSGQQPKAEQGIDLLKQLQQQAGDRLIILPGGGVNDRNARLILDQTGCMEIHGSCSDGSGTTSAESVKRILATIS